MFEFIGAVIDLVIVIADAVKDAGK